MKNLSQPDEDYPIGRGRATQQDSANLFKYITLEQIDSIINFISQNPLSSNMANEQGETPLIAAICADKPEIVKILLCNGARVNPFGLYTQEGQSTRFQRTALQVAATKGNLEIIRMLREYGANVSLVADDDATALQLAADNGHQEVVELLRIGNDGQEIVNNSAARRNVAEETRHVTNEKQTQHFRRMLKNFGSILKYIVWIIPKFFFYKLPKYVVFTVPKRTLATIVTDVWTLCQRQTNKLPNPLKRVADLADSGTKKATNVIIKTPGKAWQIMKRIPNAAWTIMLCIGIKLGKLGSAALHIAKRMASFVQTIIAAVVGFFRATTLHDITNGFRAIVRAILVDVPKAISWFVVAFGKTSCVVLQTVLSLLGKTVVFFAAVILGLLLWFPRKIWGMLWACGTSVRKGVEEILVLLNPKRM